ncbi:MAG: hypothetical protein ABI723_16015 [Bacteroidia bacterium]
MRKPFNKYSIFLFASFIIMVAIAIITSCKKSATPENPFDAVNYNVNPPPVDTTDPSSIQGLHKNIFSTKCAMPGCHDGNFEPDYRTVQSTYSTLVFQKPVKNNATNSFKYRVLPYDTAHSWLHERLTTADTVLGRMPLYSTPLSQTEMAHVNKWIMDGAKDMFGNPAVLSSLPNTPPQVLGYGAFSGNTQIDTNRANGLFYNPFLISDTTNFVLALLVVDDSTAIQNLTINQLKISTSKDDFSSAVVYNTLYLMIPGSGEIWYAPIYPSALPKNVQLYMRYYVGDGIAGNNIEYPNNQSPDYYKSYYSFVVQ